MKNTIENYPGAKTNSGILQWLINNIPYHEVYYELFAGSAQLFRNKKSAKESVLSDIDKSVCKELKNLKLDAIIYNTDARHFLNSFQEIYCYPIGGKPSLAFIYLDPPYPKTARRSGKKYYTHEMLEDFEHKHLLQIIKTLPAAIMISTRQNELYDLVLHDWRKETFKTMGRQGVCEEVIYMNYPIPSILHQYDYVGDGYVDRQRIKRKVTRFGNKIHQLPNYERHLFIQELIKNDSAAVKMFLELHHPKL